MGAGSFEDDLYTGTQRILLNSSLRLGTYGTEMKTFFLTSRPISQFIIRVGTFFLGSLIIQSG